VAASNSLPARSVAVPGSLVDCVVVVGENGDGEDVGSVHGMSYVTREDPFLSSTIKKPLDEIETMSLTMRKVIARRAAFALKGGQVVNLGIGIPEGVASVASEEGMLDYITLTTEAGSFGGIPASGHNFGPSSNASALIEMNQMFDFYDGGGLDICFLGAAQINARGDVNVSRLSKDRLVGPGGFIDISQSTRSVCFLLPVTAKGLDVHLDSDGRIKIKKEGTVKKFVENVFETTFSGDEAIRRGQKVYYVTERAVFRRCPEHNVLELVEIAPGIDLQKDVLGQMEFEPVISPNLKLMDERIFKTDKMDLLTEMFGSLESRCAYHEHDHTFFLDLFHVNLATKDDVYQFFEGLDNIMGSITSTKGKFHVVVNYDGFDLRAGLEETYRKCLKTLEDKHYRSVRRFAGNAFHRAKLGTSIHMTEWDPLVMFDKFDTANDGTISRTELRKGMEKYFGLTLSEHDLERFGRTDKGGGISRREFVPALKQLLLLSGRTREKEEEQEKLVG